MSHARLYRPKTLLISVAVLAALSACSRKDPLASGKELLAKGEISGAVIELKNAVQAQPNSADARIQLANALERTHDLASVEEQLRKAVDAGADANQLVPRIALVMLDRGDMDKLVRDFKDRKLSDAQADSTLRGTVALALTALKRLPAAKEQIAHAADSPAVALARAQMLASEGQIAEGMKVLQAASQAQDAPWWVFRATGRLASSANDPAQALVAIKKAHDAVPWHIGVQGEYGETLAAAGKFSEAAAVRDALKKKAPNHFWTHYLDALLLAQADRPQESQAAALRVLKVSPEHMPATLLAASAELRSGDVKGAVKRLQAANKRQPDSLPILRLLAQGQLRSGNLTDAAQLVRQGLVLAPNDATMLGLRADLEAARGDKKAAAATLAQVVAQYPDDATSVIRLAQARFAAGDNAEAAKLLDHAAELAKQDHLLLGRVIAVSLRLGRVDQARRMADAAVSAAPQDAQARLNLAAVMSAQNDRTGAWKTTLAVLDTKPNLPAALTALGTMAKTPEQRQEYVARLGKAVAAGNTSADVYADYASLLQTGGAGKSGDTPLSVLEQGVKAVPDSANLREALVNEHLRLGQPEKALTVAESGAAMTNAPAAVLEVQASTYERLGKQQQATEAYRKLAAAYPQRGDWRLRLAQLEANNDRTAEAASLLRALITERPYDPGAYLALASLMSRSNANEALSVARQLGQQEGLAGMGLLLEGDVLVATDKPDDALKAYASAVKAGMTPAGNLRIIKTLDRLSRTVPADQQMAELMRKQPDSTAVIQAAAERAMVAGQPAQAVELLQQLSAKMPNNPVLLNDLAWAQVQARKPEALANARKAADALPNNANVLDTLGSALAAAGQRDEAVTVLRMSSRLAPTAATPKVHLAEVLLAGGDRTGASEALRGVDANRLDKLGQASLAKVKAALGQT
ncbi:XrtA/PEP-CTERM system TPR-repeat protein PrsT [Roseateles sp. BYS87W]|uniref:XrtA/PEP-CTERM system TPR-repeat protein PrsT n=1 Tax=Pelomonas baiyunensis TaxID=3299026 RepID=A0ABW7GY77_9BURK